MWKWESVEHSFHFLGQFLLHIPCFSFSTGLEMAPTRGASVDPERGATCWSLKRVASIDPFQDVFYIFLSLPSFQYFYLNPALEILLRELTLFTGVVLAANICRKKNVFGNLGTTYTQDISSQLWHQNPSLK